MKKLKSILLIIFLLSTTIVFASLYFVSKSEHSLMSKEIAWLQSENDSLTNKNKENKHEIARLEEKEDKLQKELERKQGAVTKIDREYKKLQAEFEKVQNRADKTHIDSLYKFLIEKAYQYEAESEIQYSFNKKQVREIHKTYNKKLHLSNTNELLYEKNSMLSDVIDIYSKQNRVLDNKYTALENTNDNLRKIADNKKQMYKTCSRELLEMHDSNTRLRYIAGGSGSLAVIAIIASLIN